MMAMRSSITASAVKNFQGYGDPVAQHGQHANGKCYVGGHRGCRRLMRGVPMFSDK